MSRSYAEMFAKRLINDLIFEFDGGERWVYNPKDDITPLEVAHISHLFIVASSQSMVNNDYKEFIVRHKLERHFDKVEK